MLQFKLHTRHIFSFITSLLFCIFIVPINQSIAFTAPSARRNMVVAHGLTLLFGIFFYCLALFAVHFVQKLREHDPLYLNWLKFTGIYFAIMLVVFLLIYPGHWVGDEFTVLNAVKHYNLYAWQNYFTNIFYTFCLFIVPTGVSIIVFQFTFASFAIGYVLMQLQRLLHNKRLAYLALIPFLLFPVVIYNFYPLRVMMYSYIELLLICKLLFDYYYKLRMGESTYFEIIKITTLVMLLCFWRPEGIYYIATLPFLFVHHRIFTTRTRRTLAPYLLLGFCIVTLGSGWAITKATSNPAYELTAYINPLSTMIQKPLKGQDVSSRLAQVDKVINIQVLKKYPSYVEIPAFWYGGLRPDYAPHVANFKKQYLYLVLHNPGAFLQNRTRTFLLANSFYNTPSPSLGSLDGDQYNKDPVTIQFMADNLGSKPLNPKLKLEISKILLSLKSLGVPNASAHFFWNSIIPMTLLLILGIAKLVKRQYLWAVLAGLVLLRVPLMFLTEPADYSFYYQSVYMIGYFLVAFAAIEYIDRRDLKRSAH